MVPAPYNRTFGGTNHHGVGVTNLPFSAIDLICQPRYV